jgi:cytochrome P450
LFLTGNQTIRKGTPVVIFIHGILHDASVFHNPEKFDPERFAEGSKLSDERSQFDFIPFSIGSRNCIGK